MRMEKLNKALDHIDYDLIDEFVREREAHERVRSRRRMMARLIPVAACFVIFIGVGSAMLGYGVAGNENKSDFYDDPSQVQLIFQRNGEFLFEYEGRLYKAYVSPAISTEGVDLSIDGSVSIQSVGEHISYVTVTDENGVTATMEIYSSKDSSGDDGILLKLASGYFKATLN